MRTLLLCALLLLSGCQTQPPPAPITDTPKPIQTPTPGPTQPALLTRDQLRDKAVAIVRQRYPDCKQEGDDLVLPDGQRLAMPVERVYADYQKSPTDLEAFQDELVDWSLAQIGRAQRKRGAATPQT